MCMNVTLYQYKFPTNYAGRIWKRCKVDAGGMHGRRRDASQKRREAWTQEGRMRDADGSISYSLAHMIFIVSGSLIA